MPRIPLPADDDIPAASRPVLEVTEKRLGFVPNMHRALSTSQAVLNGQNDLQGALSRTLDATTRRCIAHAVAEVNGCRYCEAVHTLAAVEFGGVPVEELDLYRQGRATDPRRSAAHAGLAPVARDSGRVQGHQQRPHRYHHGLRRIFSISTLGALRACPTSQAYYDRKRAEGKTHRQAAAALSRLRVDVHWPCVRDNKPRPPKRSRSDQLAAA